MPTTHDVVPESLKVTTKKKGGRADVQALLVHTTVHPKGRLQLDPKTGEVENPKNNVLFVKKMAIKVENIIVGHKDVPVNGGHVCAAGTIWRIPLNGPSRYHMMILADKHGMEFQGQTHRTAPKLSKEESEEYQFFLAFLDIEKIETELMPSSREDAKECDALDNKFWNWLEKQDRAQIKVSSLGAYRPNIATDVPVK